MTWAKAMCIDGVPQAFELERRGDQVSVSFDKDDELEVSINSREGNLTVYIPYAIIMQAIEARKKLTEMGVG